MAIGLLLVIIGVWVLVNGLNGNLAGLFAGTHKIDTNVTTQDPKPVITPGKQ